jgi:branched-chain amino acid transport system permease protein
MVGITGDLAFLVNMAILAGTFSILALGLNLQWGETGLFNISVAAFWGIGAYTAAIVTLPPSAETAFGLNLPYLWVDIGGIPIPIPPAILLAAAISGIVAAFIGIPTLRLRADYLAIATLGLAEIIRLIILNEEWLTRGGRGLSVNNPLTGVDYAQVWLLVIVIAVLVVVYWLVERGVSSPWGRVLNSIREDETVVQALGKNTFSYKMQAFVIGSMIMGATGALTALRINFLVPRQFTPEWTFFIWIAVIVGGSGNNRGAVLGGVFLAVLLQAPRFLVEFVPSGLGNVAVNFRLLLIGTVLILVMTYRPQGFLGDESTLVDRD